MTEFLYPAELSHSATTGPSVCSNGDFNRCFFDVNGEQSESLMVTDDEIDFLVNVFGTCELTILAVGGGGKGRGQGGGSGNIHYEKILESSDGITNFTLNARAGGGSTASSVPHYGIVANPGHNGDANNGGGDGYSGGGEFNYYTDSGCNGGTDGSAGESSHGGSGTSEDIGE